MAVSTCAQPWQACLFLLEVLAFSGLSGTAAPLCLSIASVLLLEGAGGPMLQLGSALVQGHNVT